MTTARNSGTGPEPRGGGAHHSGLEPCVCEWRHRACRRWRRPAIEGSLARVGYQRYVTYPGYVRCNPRCADVEAFGVGAHGPCHRPVSDGLVCRLERRRRPCRPIVIYRRAE